MMICVDFDQYVDVMIDSYIETGLWSSLNWEWIDAHEKGQDHPVYTGENLDADFDADDLSDEARASIREDVESFVRAAGTDLDGIDPRQAGHDFLLTRDHHGAGFWDRGLGDLGDRLTDLSHPYGDSGFYIGDDGRIHVQ